MTVKSILNFCISVKLFIPKGCLGVERVHTGAIRLTEEWHKHGAPCGAGFPYGMVCYKHEALSELESQYYG